MKIYFDYLLIKMFYLSAILNLRELDSIAVSVFADVFIELTNTNNSIRRQDPNNFSDVLRRGALSNESTLKGSECVAIAIGPTQSARDNR